MRNAETEKEANMPRRGGRGRPMDGEIMSVDSAARFLGITPKTVYSRVYR
jgi:hypothetical protein